MITRFRAAVLTFFSGPRALLFPSIAFVFAFFVFPVAALLVSSLGDSTVGLTHYKRLFSEPVYVEVLLNTLKIATCVTLASAMAGYPYAYAMTKMPLRWRTLALTLVLLPFWTSILVRSYAWIALLQREGAVNSFLIGTGLISEPAQLVYNLHGVMLGMTYVMLPYMILILYSGMRLVDTRLVIIARTLGASPTTAFRRVFLPMTLPSLLAAGMLVFILSLGYFITPALLGGPGETTIAMLVDTEMNQLLDWGMGSALATVLLFVVVVLLVICLKVFPIERVLRGA